MKYTLAIVNSRPALWDSRAQKIAFLPPAFLLLDVRGLRTEGPDVEAVVEQFHPGPEGPLSYGEAELVWQRLRQGDVIVPDVPARLRFPDKPIIPTEDAFFASEQARDIPPEGFTGPDVWTAPSAVVNDHHAADLALRDALRLADIPSKDAPAIPAANRDDLGRVVDSNAKPLLRPGWFMRLLIAALDKCFRYESMSGNGKCPVYLERWTLLLACKCGVYLHHFLGDDWALDPHDHPRRFISIGLWGWYWEDVFHNRMDLDRDKPKVGSNPPRYGQLIRTLKHRAPWFRTFPANHLHLVRASECGNCWTLVVVLPKSRDWGFVQNGVWHGFKSYVFGGKSRPSC